MSSRKRRLTPDATPENAGKRIKLSSVADSTTQAEPSTEQTNASSTQPRSSTAADNRTKHPLDTSESSAHKRQKIIKLAAPKPFPTVAPSASATGPPSAHKEGKNFICLTRKTSLSTYMRRCKKLLVDQGFTTLHLHAMGAAIPLLLQLSCALPPILPFSKDEIHTEVTTGTVEVHDEILPEDEGEDITYRSRGKSTLYVVIRIGESVERPGTKQTVKRKKANESSRFSAKQRPEMVVYAEPEQELPEI